MKRTERYACVIAYFEEHMPLVETELEYRDPFQLLVSVILSAQCTDKRVNLKSPAIFRDFPDAKSLSTTNFDTLFPYIKSISYPNSKTKHLISMANMLVNDFEGKVPMNIPDLMKLPGVGRKTANVITSVIDHQPNMAVDTHVFRVSARIGLTLNAKTPYATEMQLVQYIPKELIHKAHHWLILHGRYICVARKPKCDICGISHCCKYFKKYVENKKPSSILNQQKI